MPYMNCPLDVVWITTREIKEMSFWIAWTRPVYLHTITLWLIMQAFWACLPASSHISLCSFSLERLDEFRNVFAPTLYNTTYSVVKMQYLVFERYSARTSSFNKIISWRTQKRKTVFFFLNNITGEEITRCTSVLESTPMKLWWIYRYILHFLYSTENEQTHLSLSHVYVF